MPTLSRRSRVLRTVLAVLLALVAAAGGALVALAVTTDDRGTDRPTVERIEEDDPRWDCATMGNGQCGPAVNA